VQQGKASGVNTQRLDALINSRIQNELLSKFDSTNFKYGSKDGLSFEALRVAEIFSQNTKNPDFGTKL